MERGEGGREAHALRRTTFSNTAGDEIRLPQALAAQAHRRSSASCATTSGSRRREDGDGSRIPRRPPTTVFTTALLLDVQARFCLRLGSGHYPH